VTATSWNSELPSGRNPFWIKDDALAGLGLRAGDAVSVDTRREPSEGDLVLVEVETEEFSDRIVRLYYTDGGDAQVRLMAANSDFPELRLSADQMIVLGVVFTRVRFESAADDSVKVVEEEI
jgi:SOS-response transcriptional repressor LexA